MAATSTINTLVYEPKLCTGCELCTIVCPHGVFGMNGRAARLVRPEACMECGACQLNCLAGAITVDSGVGCAAAMIGAALRGQEEASCGSESGAACCGPDTGGDCCGPGSGEDESNKARLHRG